jgi:hypothetical protein
VTASTPRQGLVTQLDFVVSEARETADVSWAVADSGRDVVKTARLVDRSLQVAGSCITTILADSFDGRDGDFVCVVDGDWCSLVLW